MDKKDCVIWVTGASSGIGKEAAREFARAGFKVAASSRRHNMLELLNRELNPENLSVRVMPCNMASSSNVSQTVSRINSEAGEIDCLINNAGVTSFKPAEENTLSEIKEIIEVNLLGAIYSIKAVLPGMIKRKRGTIINILSTAALEVLPGSSAYSASKAGLLAYTDVLREEVRKHNIKVIDVIPGPTRTPMWPREMLEEHGSRMMNPEEIGRMLVSVYLQNKTLVTEKIIIKPIGGSI